MPENLLPKALNSEHTPIVQIRFDRDLTPHALSIALQEGTLVMVGFQSSLLPRVHTGSFAGLQNIHSQAQPSFGRI